MRVPPLLGVTTAVIVLGACGAPQARQEEAARAGRFFEESLAAGDFRAACALLAPESREQLAEGEEKPCAEALAGQDLPRGGGVRSVDVYGRQALLGLRGDTLFLSEFDEGWRVVAAGCVAEPGDTPYHCVLKGA
ncbi:hypothetical protein ACIQ62_15830 [Streptomyces sp. NPDC096319]|uniref:hypothetical protein n=1 Tax=Streptomyces sp. NPDC096319 TaxID=3366084 RepID=UPI0038019596